jgi:hypothetical protein
MPMRRVFFAGLIAMGVVALISAIWPGFAGIVAAIFGTALALVVLVTALLGAWWLWAEVTAWRELHGMAAVEAPWAAGEEPGAPTLTQLRESA